MDQKRRSYGFKALTEPDEAGTFEAIVSVFGNVDEYGDRVVQGAFAKTIERTGGVFPVVWTHAWGVVPVGKTISAEETEEGLLVKGELLIDDHDVARQLHACFKRGVPMEFSFSYDIKASQQVTEDGVDILELLELDVIEVGPCLIGANRETRLVGAKSGDDPAAIALVTAQVEAAAKSLGLVSASDVESLVQAALDAHTPSGQDGSSTPPPGGEDGFVGLDPIQQVDLGRYLAI